MSSTSLESFAEVKSTENNKSLILPGSSMWEHTNGIHGPRWLMLLELVESKQHMTRKSELSVGRYDSKISQTPDVDINFDFGGRWKQFFNKKVAVDHARIDISQHRVKAMNEEVSTTLDGIELAINEWYEFTNNSVLDLGVVRLLLQFYPAHQVTERLFHLVTLEVIPPDEEIPDIVSLTETEWLEELGFSVPRWLLKQALIVQENSTLGLPQALSVALEYVRVEMGIPAIDRQLVRNRYLIPAT